ncbi:helix-turn-helix transcriptional regulator [Lentzea sp. NPDC003310]|uniref:helix-turn-helix domain-containing protein n=1 Tax=Lentzea sp. NPDC003310 TaxID=3154447 RepID=UPI0033A46D48
MTSAGDPAVDLAQRLRSLRKQSWPDKRITQEGLAQAFDVSVPLISSWERLKDPVLPPPHRLHAYAIFFATVRSVERQPYRLIEELTEEEQTRRDELLAELTGLRDQLTDPAPSDTAPTTDNLWRFPVDEDITIVCSEVPQARFGKLPFVDPDDPDYVESYRYSDLDSLIELHGHIRAFNPNNNVHIRTGARSLSPDEYTSHLVLLGGIDWNQVTAAVLHRIDLPVRQLARPYDSDPGGFEIMDTARRTLRPVLNEVEGRMVLEEDIAHFYRSPNPFNRKRTITICNGQHSRGTLGVVRALTDARFRDRNNTYLCERFAGHDTFSIISRVQVLEGSVVTPDWTVPEILLHEWPATAR